jgi:hypothetical protein
MNPAIVAAIIQQQVASASKGLLSMWTVYDHLADYPNDYVARCFEMDQPTDIVFVGTSEEIRESLATCGLVRLQRFVEDHAKVVETWV